MIIAVDFDGVLCRNRFPEIGPPNYSMISIVRRLIDQGEEVILWTSRVDAELDSAVEWCKDRGLKFCSVNENAPSNIAKYIKKYPNGTRKVYADIYVDDHSLEFIRTVQDGGYEKALNNMESILRRLLADER